MNPFILVEKDSFIRTVEPKWPSGVWLAAFFYGDGAPSFCPFPAFSALDSLSDITQGWMIPVYSREADPEIRAAAAAEDVLESFLASFGKSSESALGAALALVERSDMLSDDEPLVLPEGFSPYTVSGGLDNIRLFRWGEVGLRLTMGQNVCDAMGWDSTTEIGLGFDADLTRMAVVRRRGGAKLIESGDAAGGGRTGCEVWGIESVPPALARKLSEGVGADVSWRVDGQTLIIDLTRVPGWKPFSLQKKEDEVEARPRRSLLRAVFEPFGSLIVHTILMAIWGAAFCSGIAFVIWAVRKLL